MVEALLLVGFVVAAFVGYNIGGATTGPAFGPAVGADVLSKSGAAALMSVFFFIGAGTLGQRVVTTLGEDLVTGGNVFTLETSIVVLFFIGGALFVGNFAGVPASTSMTAVGAIAGLGLATGTLDRAVMGEIAIWWIVAPIIGFWVSGVVGRYFYPAIDSWVAIESTEGSLFVFDRSGIIPKPVLGPNTTRREFVGGFVVIAIGCLMAFSSGTSNIANAIAPLRRARQRRDDTDDPPRECRRRCRSLHDRAPDARHARQRHHRPPADRGDRSSSPASPPESSSASRRWGFRRRSSSSRRCRSSASAGGARHEQ